jgi:hypothetical protein
VREQPQDPPPGSVEPRPLLAPAGGGEGGADGANGGGAGAPGALAAPAGTVL